MKLPFTIHDLRFTVGKQPPASAVAVRQSSIANRKSQRGVALVITLILLSVTLLMALAFLAISNRERGSVNTSIDTATARLAADAGQQFVEAQIAANILSSANPYNFGPISSVNYQPTRPQVWLSNIVTHAMEDRFYLDLNRNGMDDPNGGVTNVDNLGHPILDGSGNPVVNYQIGDPVWIGVLARPDQPFGPNNPYVARFAVFGLPVGNSLDFNAIHNQALVPAMNYSMSPIAQDYYARNQGVGSWEINLAAFLTDLNTNEWDFFGNQYNYQQPLPGNWGNSPNKGRGFEDAFALLTNRYAASYNSMLTLSNLYGLPGFTALVNDSVDYYTEGPLMTGVPAPKYPQRKSIFVAPWLGANNTNHYFTPQELFNTAETAGFGAHLLNAGTNFFGGTVNSTYDRYTYYRMLSQIGTESAPESGKMNINYNNLDPGINGVASATNFMAWTPLGFFTNAADRMLKAYTAQWATSYVTTNGGASLLAVVNTNYMATFNMNTPFGVTGIPVWVSNRMVYTSAVQRLLQLAANIYDATTTNYYPSVFRPVFTSSNGNVFITGYTPATVVTNFADPQFAQPIDAVTLSAMSGANLAVNVFGVPWIIGAKKGFPNFNEFELENVFQLTRKLQLTRPNTSVTYWQNPNAYVNSQQLTISMTNMIGVECWNSYMADYTHPVLIQVKDFNTLTLTNDEGFISSLPSFAFTNAASISGWPGYGTIPLYQPNPQSFVYGPLEQGEVVLPGWIYTFDTSAPFIAQAPAFFAANNRMPHWTLLVTNRLQVVMLESNHIIDYAQLTGPENSLDLTASITNLYDTYYDRNNGYRTTTLNGYNDMWDPITNSVAPFIPKGIANQIAVSMASDPIILNPEWGGWSGAIGSGSNPVDVTNQIAAFRAFLGFGALAGASPGATAMGRTALSMQAPYTPTALIASIMQWEVNDPLVHYLASDLSGSSQNAQPQQQVLPLTFGVLNDRYMPWGGNVKYPNFDTNSYNRTIKDPLRWSSDYWNFPTNKLPTTGWLGRIHRGTPWQTVYLKSADVLSAWRGLDTWMNWSGDYNFFDAAYEAPVQDRLLFDLFTTAINDNASRGTLSVNVGSGADNLAAWSALFSGIAVSTNLAGGYTVISPAGVYDPTTNLPPLVQIVQSINNARGILVNPDGLGGVFEHPGDILRAPALTDLSPYLSGMNASNQVSDEMIEWLPQQTMSLLRLGTPRYVIYSYGQALKPAQNGVDTAAGSATFGTVTKYQVAAEVATRTVVRIETLRTNVNGTVTMTPPHAVIESFNIMPPD